MVIGKRGVLLMSAPALGAFLLSSVLLGGIIQNVGDKVSEGIGATGYVTVSVYRDGKEIYHYEDHNLITNAGRDFILQQIGGSASTSTAKYIGLSSNTAPPAATDIALTDEITGGGLGRTLGTFNQGTGSAADSFSITATFTAIGNHYGVRKAGLFTAAYPGGTMVAENTFSPVNVLAGDNLTIKWTIDLGLP